VDLGANGLVAIRLPILLPRPAQWDPASILACCRPRIEVFDKILRPESISVLAPDESPFRRVPGNCVLAIATFTFRVLPSRKWIPIVASYDQPLTQQQFHYLPTFEEPDMKISANDFSVTVFTTADGRRLRLLSKQKTDRLGISSRLNVTPRHQELISVAVD
jgi:hypothetical protein